jgi:hypothetical protein
MKIDSSLISAPASGSPRGVAGEVQDAGATGVRSTPTVGPASAMPTGLANVLWLANAKLGTAGDAGDSLITEYLELSKLTPAERLRQEMLEEMGLTEDSLKELPEGQREAAEEEIRRAIKEQLGLDETRQAQTRLTETQEAGAVEGQPVARTEEAEA